jgi:hypothetical protein
MCASCPTHLILLGLITPVTYGEAYTLWSSRLLPLPPSYVQILSSALCSQAPSVYVLPLVWKTMFHTHTKQVKWYMLISKFLERR